MGGGGGGEYTSFDFAATNIPSLELVEASCA